MELSRAIETIEYKIATESEDFTAGRPLRLNVTQQWPAISALEDVLIRRYPSVQLSYDMQENDVQQLIIQRKPSH